MNYILNLNQQQVQKIISKYQQYKLSLTSPYMSFRAKVRRSSITIFKTNKILIQGNDIELYQEICNFLGIKSQTINITKENNYNIPLSIIGTDEVGTGDYFGGIVVCACLVEKKQILEIRKLGVKDSKILTDNKINEIAPQLIQKLTHSVIYLNNDKYNKIIQNVNINMNKIKAVLHNKVLLKILEKNIQYDKIVIDGFTTKTKYFSYLQNQKNIIENVTLEEKGESKYLAIASASIIARYYFLKKFNEISLNCGYKLMKGAGKEVDLMIAKIIKDGNESILPNIAKINFKNTHKAKNYLN